MELDRFNPRPQTQRCPYCRDTFLAKERLKTCRQCQACHHRDCWSEGGGCSSCVRSDAGQAGRAGRAERQRPEFTPEALEARRAWRRRRDGLLLLAVTVIAVLLVGLAAGIMSYTNARSVVTYRSSAEAPWARTVRLGPDAELGLDDPAWLIRCADRRSPIVVVDMGSGAEIAQLDNAELRGSSVSFEHGGYRYTAFGAEHWDFPFAKSFLVTFTRAP